MSMLERASSMLGKLGGSKLVQGAGVVNPITSMLPALLQYGYPYFKDANFPGVADSRRMRAAAPRQGLRDWFQGHPNVAMNTPPRQPEGPPQAAPHAGDWSPPVPQVPQGRWAGLEGAPETSSVNRPAPQPQGNPFPTPMNGNPFPTPIGTPEKAIPGMNPHVGNMADPAQLEGALKARQVMDPATGAMMNDFYAKSFPSFFNPQVR
jgi:hypothetical protein